MKLHFKRDNITKFIRTQLVRMLKELRKKSAARHEIENTERVFCTSR